MGSPPHNTSPAVHSVYTMLVSVVLLVTLAHLSAGRDCTPPSKADCAGQNASNMKPWPCNCHKYWQCVDYDVVEYDCAPLSLIFDPLIEQCVQEENAPPGICQDTPNDTTTPAPTPSPTTARPTTTTEAPSTTPRNCWICPGCTCSSADYDGFFKPHPDNCHWYYQCVHHPNDPECEWTSEGPYDCGDWAFNPNQASCTWPELVPDCQ